MNDSIDEVLDVLKFLLPIFKQHKNLRKNRTFDDFWNCRVAVSKGCVLVIEEKPL
jgi:hypothetical protein